MVLAILVMMFISMVLVWQYQNFSNQAKIEQRQIQELNAQVKNDLNLVKAHRRLVRFPKREAVSSLEFPEKNR